MKSTEDDNTTQDQLLLEVKKLSSENRELKAKLAESEETLRAIRSGEVDAIVISADGGEQVYTLKGAEEPYRVLFEQMNEGAVTISEDGGILYCNQSFSKAMRTSIERIIGSNFESYLRPSDVALFRELLHQSVIEPARNELMFQARDGSIVPMQLSINSLPTAKVLTFCIVVADLTERIQAEEALKKANDELEQKVKERTRDLSESESKFRDLFETVQEVFYIDKLIYDDQEKVIDWIFEDLNPAGFALLGLKDINEAKGKRGSEVLGPKVASFYLPMIEEARRSDKAVTFQYHSPCVDKEFLTSYVVHGDRLISAQMDITDIKRAQQEAEDYAEKLKRSNTELQHFAYVASHDLQEPLRMVTGYLQLLEKKNKDKLDERSREYIHYAVDGATRMKGLTDDLLEYSRVETSGKEFEQTDMEVVLSTVEKHLIDSIKGSNATITHDPLPTVRADRLQMIQLIQNLVANALKFHGSDAPHIHVSAVKKGREWLFSVQDNGIGIDPKHKDRIFEMFQRLHSREEFPGTGIGLAISKKVVERHGGRIWVKSEEGKGATFFFTIPRNGRGEMADERGIP